jgi:hypothetical protein
VPFFHYSQNNSGGVFDYDADAGISDNVIIEADSAEHANDRAQEIGIYFDGVSDGHDCDCCGDRWYEIRSGGEGNGEPMIYGRPLAEHEPFGWIDGFQAFVHYADGRVVGHFPSLRKDA